MSEVTNDEHKVAIIWEWLQHVKAPVAVKIAFKALAMKHVLNNPLKYWQPEDDDDEH